MAPYLMNRSAVQAVLAIPHCPCGSCFHAAFALHCCIATMTAPCSDMAVATLVVSVPRPAWATATHCAWNKVANVHSPFPNSLHSFMDARLALPRERIELLMKVSPRASIATPRTVCAQLGRLLYGDPELLTGIGAQPCTP